MAKPMSGGGGVTLDRSDFEMRSPCRCGHSRGRIVEKSGQDTVRCLACNAYCYCAPRAETGRDVRRVKTRNGIPPWKKAAVILRDGNRCVLCKDDDAILHAGHIISRDIGIQIGMSDDDVDDEENLAAMCETCNLGIGNAPIPLTLAYLIFKARKAYRESQRTA